jgi:diadenylate cyclase
VAERLLAITFPRISLATVIDILLVAFLVYQFLLIIRGRRALPILTGIFMLLGAYVLSVRWGLVLLRSVLEGLAPYTVFALIVMFQSDIRRLLARMGRQTWLPGGQNVDRREFAQELLLTLSALSHQKTGALMVLERDIGLRTFIESGVRIDGALSRDLLLSVFHVGTAMHDGAVIIQGDRIAAASCFLPLSMNPRIMSTLGTRHRAAIGVTEETDCLSLVVSEETGRMSVAAFGEVETGLTLEQVEARILTHFGSRRKRPAGPSRSAEETTSSKRKEVIR